MLSEEVCIALLPEQYHISSKHLYISSFENGAQFLRSDINNVLLNGYSFSVFAAGKVKRSCIGISFINKEVRKRLRHSISDPASRRKRKAWDTVLTALGYDCLQSRYAAQIYDQKRTRGLQIRKAKDWASAYFPGGAQI